MRNLAWLPCVTALATTASCGSRTPLLDSEPVGEVSTVEEDGPPPGCKPGRFELEPAKPQLMFVIDRSGSMAFDLSGETRVSRSRWATLEDGLRQTIVPLSGQVAMGAKFFPEVSANFADGCRSDRGVALAPALNNAQAILDVFRTTSPLGGTPTAEAVRLAAEFVGNQRKVGRAIVLATDGAPNCNSSLQGNSCLCTLGNCNGPGSQNCLDDVRTVDVIGTIFRQRQIPVFVLGIGGGERPSYLATLDAMAVAGGRPKLSSPKYHDAQTPAELDSALTTIRDSVARCTYLTPSVPTNPDAISIEIEGAVVRRDTAHIDGWDWVDKTYGVIAVFGAACATAVQKKTVDGVVACSEE